MQYADNASAANAMAALEGHAIYDGGYNRVRAPPASPPCPPSLSHLAPSPGLTEAVDMEAPRSAVANAIGCVAGMPPLLLIKSNLAEACGLT